jgi:hypothetical protein
MIAKYDRDMGYRHKCPECGTYWYDSDKMCPECRPCEACGRVVKPGCGAVIGGAVFCADCATNVDDMYICM